MSWPSHGRRKSASDRRRRLRQWIDPRARYENRRERVLFADVARARRGTQILSRKSDRRFTVFVSWPIGTDQGQKNLQPPAAVRKDSAPDIVQRSHGKKSGSGTAGSLERIEAQELSCGREAHNEGIE